MPEEFEELSPSEFFWRHKDLAGFTNPMRAIYGTIRELVENSLDAAEVHGIPLKLHLKSQGWRRNKKGSRAARRLYMYTLKIMLAEFLERRFRTLSAASS